MDAFVSRKQKRQSPPPPSSSPPTASSRQPVDVKRPASAETLDDDSTELKLAILASLHPGVDQGLLLDVLLANQGSVEDASTALSKSKSACSSMVKPKAPPPASGSYQSSLASFSTPTTAEGGGGMMPGSNITTKSLLTRKGKTLHLYSPEDVAAHTPCSIIHNFLPAQEANDLLKELLEEVPTFKSQTFKLFENFVQSPHTACFYVQDVDEQRRQMTEYLYNGAYLTVRLLLNMFLYLPSGFFFKKKKTHGFTGCSSNHAAHATRLFQGPSRRE